MTPELRTELAAQANLWQAHRFPKTLIPVLTKPATLPRGLWSYILSPHGVPYESVITPITVGATVEPTDHYRLLQAHNQEVLQLDPQQPSIFQQLLKRLHIHPGSHPIAASFPLQKRELRIASLSGSSGLSLSVDLNDYSLPKEYGPIDVVSRMNSGLLVNQEKVPMLLYLPKLRIT